MHAASPIVRPIAQAVAVAQPVAAARPVGLRELAKAAATGRSVPGALEVRDAFGQSHPLLAPLMLASVAACAALGFAVPMALLIDGPEWGPLAASYCGVVGAGLGLMLCLPISQWMPRRPGRLQIVVAPEGCVAAIAGRFDAWSWSSLGSLGPENSARWGQRTLVLRRGDGAVLLELSHRVCDTSPEHVAAHADKLRRAAQ